MTTEQLKEIYNDIEAKMLGNYSTVAKVYKLYDEEEAWNLYDTAAEAKVARQTAALSIQMYMKLPYFIGAISVDNSIVFEYNRGIRALLEYVSSKRVGYNEDIIIDLDDIGDLQIKHFVDEDLLLFILSKYGTEKKVRAVINCDFILVKPIKSLAYNYRGVKCN